ncbi:MAG: hypothetical protein HZB82_06375 [Deltaproteobacteria bacterium]|nr:hypothetical protein [Deltaproteobacteria bacterium]
MSFYTKIKTELRSKRYLMAALEELKKRGEITNFILSKGKIQVDRQGDIINIGVTKEGMHEVAGDNRVVRVFSDRLKQVYALESIKDNLPLDFEVARETETAAGEILILLKG